MNQPLAAQRCFHHPPREAVARCPECERFFCRECITEHDDRVICADCLRKIHAPTTKPRRRLLPGLSRAVKCAAALLLAWVFFYTAGRLLLTIPSSFHEGTLWSTGE